MWKIPYSESLFSTFPAIGDGFVLKMSVTLLPEHWRMIGATLVWLCALEWLFY